MLCARCEKMLNLLIILLTFCYCNNGCFVGKPMLKAPSNSTSPEAYNQLPEVRTSPLNCGHSKYWRTSSGYDATISNSFPTGSGIINGVESLPNEFPFQAAIITHTDMGTAAFCGGVVLNELWVMTAAHCIQSYSYATVTLGKHDLTVIAEGEHTREVEQAVPHPLFSNKSFDYDFALLKLGLALNFTSWYVQPVCLPSSCSSSCQEGDIAFMSGWGRTSSNSDLSNVLRKAKLPVVGVWNCALSQSGFAVVTNRMICAGYDTMTTDSCRGDSGSPLVVVKNGYYELCAVNSHGMTGCANSDTFGVYSRVCAVRSWVKEITGS